MRVTNRVKMILSRIQAHCAQHRCVSCRFSGYGHGEGCVFFNYPKEWAIERLESESEGSEK
jgi:hypothetical protein